MKVSGKCAFISSIRSKKRELISYSFSFHVRHEIVHNKHVVDSLKKIGAIFVEEIEEINGYCLGEKYLQ